MGDIISIVSAVVMIVAYVVTTSVSQKFFRENFAEFKQDVKEDIGRLERKQDKHNCLIERMAVVESSMKSAHHRLDSIERKVG